MLGTPNNGSFSPVQALSGYHSLVRKVAALDLKHDEKDLVNDIFSTFTGLYEMLPAPDRFTAMDLFNLDNWAPTETVPRKDLLKAAPGIHQHLAPNDDRFVLIAGINQDTVVGVHRTGDSFVFTQSARRRLSRTASRSTPRSSTVTSRGLKPRRSISMVWRRSAQPSETWSCPHLCAKPCARCRSTSWL